MADSNINSEKDRAYIENLLSRLRETLGQTAPTAEPEATTDPTPVVEEAPEVPEASLQAETVDEDAPAQEVPVAETEAHAEEETAEEIQAEEEPLPAEVDIALEEAPKVEEEAKEPPKAEEQEQEETVADEIPSSVEEVTESEPVAEEVEATSQAPVAEETPAEEAVPEQPFTEQEQPLEAGEKKEDVPAALEEQEESPEELPIEEQEEVVAEQTTAVEPPVETPEEKQNEELQVEPEEKPEEPKEEPTPTPVEEDIPVPAFFSSTPVRSNETYAHTVVPGMTYYTEQQGQRSAPRRRDLIVPDMAEEDPSLEDGQYIISLPVPDEVQPAEVETFVTDTYVPREDTSLEHEDSAVQQISFFDNFDEAQENVPSTPPPVSDTPPSVWDVVDLGGSTPVRSAEQETPVTEEPLEETPRQEEKETPAKKKHEGPRFWQFRVPPKTYTDSSYTQDGTLVDHVLEEPQESLGGEGSKEQIALWKKDIKRMSVVAGIKCIAVGFIALLLLLYELFPNMTATVMHQLLLTRVPGALVLIDLQLLLLACLISYRTIFRGIEALRYRRILPETLMALSAIVAVFFDIILYAVKPTTPILVGLVGTLALLGACLGDFFRIKTLACAFHAYEAEGHHFAAVYTEAQRHTLLSSLFVDETAPVQVLEAEPASEIKGFIDACRTRREGHKSAFISLVIALVAALVDLIVVLALKQGGSYSFWSAVTTFCGVLPLNAFVIHRFFFFSLSWRVAKERVGIASETAVYEYANTRVMAYEDIEAFPVGSVQVNGIKLCGDFRLDKALFLMASLFDRVGGPLNGVFRVSTQDVQLSSDVMLREIHDGGIEAQVNHEDVCVGTKAFLTSIGVQVFDDPEDDRAIEGKNHVLYVAYKAQLCAKFYLQYHINSTFEGNVEYCAKNGVSTVIMTADPLLSEALIDEVSYISDYDVRVVKKTVNELEQDKQIPRTATLITYGPRKTLRRMPFFFGAYVKRQKLAGLISLGLTVLGGILVPTLMALFHSETALIPFLYQILSLAPAVGIGISVWRLDPNK